MATVGIQRLLLVVALIIGALLAGLYRLDAFALEKPSTVWQQAVTDLTYSGYNQSAWVVGKQGRLGLWVVNAGTVDLQNIEVTFYDGDPQTGGQPLGSTQVITQIMAGQSQAVQLLWTPTQVGQQRIYAWIDPTNQIAETNEGNNTVALTVIVREPAPDLAVGGLWIKGNAIHNHPTPLSVTIANYGELAAANVMVQFFEGDPQPGGVQIGTTQVITLFPAGAARQVTTTWLPSAAGMQTVYVWADFAGVIPELNETNNSSMQSFPVREPGVDLGLAYQALQGSGELVVGRSTMVALWVSNHGEVPVQNVGLRLFEGNPRQGGTPIGITEAIPEIAAQKSSLLQLAWQPSRAGAIDLYAVADPDNLIAELNETNNVMSRTVTVRAPQLDLTIPAHALQIAHEAVQGQPVAGAVQIYNNGDLPAQQVEVRFFEGEPAQGVPIGATQIVTTLAPNTNQQLPFVWQPSRAGVVAFYAVVDANNQIVESNEANNVVSRTVTIREAAIAWYVNGASAQSGNGRSPESAFRTINEAVEQAITGDTIHVAAGEYAESVTIPPGVSLLGQGYTTTKIRAVDADESPVNLYHSTVISGFTLLGQATDNGAPALAVWGGDATIRNNRLTGAATGLLLFCYSAAQKCNQPVEVAHNIIDQQRFIGINIQNGLTVTVRHNTVVSNATGILLAPLVMAALENNIVVRNTYAGIRRTEGSSQGLIQARYNNVWQNGIRWGSEQNYSGVSAGPGSLAVDPLFRQVESGDYRLLAGSPVIGQGFPAGVDMGALPFTPALASPTSLTVSPGDYRWTVAWPSQPAQGYNLYLGKRSRTYEARIDKGSATAHTLSRVPGGFTYYAAVSAYNAAGDESQLSTEVSFYVPPLTAGAYEETHPALVWSGNWRAGNDNQASGGSYLSSANLGDQVQITFAGDSLVIYRNLAPDGGWARVLIDGKTYGYLAFHFVEPRRRVPAVLDQVGPGLHQISLEVVDLSYLEPPSGAVTVDSITLPSSFAPTVVQQQALARVNWHRTIAGLPPATGVQAIHLGAQGHAEFVANNKDHPSLAGLGFHGQEPSLPGFIGRGPTDRARYFGYTGGVGEDGHFVGNPISSIDGWMATIYHRNLIMCYDCIELGYGMVNDGQSRIDVLNMGSRIYSRPSQRLIFTYPAAGQPHVPMAWDGGEVPDPLPDKPKPVGYPVSIHLFQPADTTLAAALTPTFTTTFAPQLPRSANWLITKAEVRDQVNQVVPTYLLEQNTDPARYLGPDNAFLVPHKPLKKNATYFVTLAGIDSRGQPFDQRWAFATGALVEAPTIQAQFWAEPALPINTQTINFVIRLTNQSRFSAQQLRITVNPPVNATFAPASATATQGQLQQGTQLILTLPEFPANTTVELRYQVITGSLPPAPLVVRAPVEIGWHSGNLYREQVAIINAKYLYLPLVAR